MTTRPDQSNTEAPEGDDSSGGGLRKQLEKALAQNKANETIIRSAAFEAAGIDTSKGLGKAISQVYDGDPTKDAILEFASKEYDHVPTPVGQQPHPQAAQIALGHAQLDQMGNVAGSVEQTTRRERLATAQVEGDFAAQGRIQSAQMQDMMDAQRPQAQ